MTFLIISFIAGALTVAAPCILPLLPIIIGGSVSDAKHAKSWYRPLVITASLAVSVILFTLLLKFSTSLLGVPTVVWSIISGVIVLLFGVNLLVPVFWEKIAVRSFIKSNKLLGGASKNKGLGGDVLMGAALGPVFNSCSPTYALIVASILPASFAKGFVYLISYTLGLSAMLLLIAYAGQGLVSKLGWLSNPYGWFRKFIGISFVTVGLMVIFGLDKKFQAFVLEQGWYDPISKIERSLDR